MPGARILAFEPMPDVHEALALNGAIHGLRLQVFDCALGATAGSALGATAWCAVAETAAGSAVAATAGESAATVAALAGAEAASNRFPCPVRTAFSTQRSYRRAARQAGHGADNPGWRPA